MSQPGKAQYESQIVVWVLRARQGDREAFERLVDEYDRRLLHYMRRFERDPERALDLVQDVWLTAFRRIGSLQFPHAFRTWLYKIAHTLAVSVIRRRVREPDHEILDHDSMAVDRRVSPTDETELIHLALERVAPDHREVLLLRFLEDMSLEEIAEVVGCPAGTVKSRMFYAKQALRNILEELSND